MDVKGFFRQFKGLAKSGKLGNKGFTLLELLVVVAILAAIAGTATIALKDTDARASAAAHVAMMDELNKGIGTYRVLQRNAFPNNLDSLMEVAKGAADNKAAVRAGKSTAGDLDKELFDWPEDDVLYGALPDKLVKYMDEAGITHMQYVERTDDPAATFDDGLTCASSLRELINSRGNDVVAGNIFLGDKPGKDANGCGKRLALEDGSKATFWKGTSERLVGHPDYAADGVTVLGQGKKGTYVYLLTGLGPAATLFDQNALGGMTTVPVYRHVKPDQYNRFIAVWNVGKCSADAANDDTLCAFTPQRIELAAIIDGALDTKEEELGEWDGTRSTL